MWIIWTWFGVCLRLLVSSLSCDAFCCGVVIFVSADKYNAADKQTSVNTCKIVGVGLCELISVLCVFVFDPCACS